MGLASFYLPEPDRLTEAMVRRAYMQGTDAIPWKSQTSLDGNMLRVQRKTSESGNLIIPWRTAKSGELTLSTTCLRESPTAYNLPIELARGTVGRMRNQASAWQQAGLTLASDVAQHSAHAVEALCQAATSSDNTALVIQAADAAIDSALLSIELMMRKYSRFMLKQLGKRNAFMAVNLGTHPGARFPSDLLKSVNTAVVPLPWSAMEGTKESKSADSFAEQVRWCKKLGLHVCGGPLLNFAKNGLPDWLYLWEDDPEALESYMLQYVESTVQRFAGRVGVWHAWAGLNDCQAMQLSEEFRVRIAVGALERLRAHDATSPVFVSFHQPFSEYMARKSLDLAPIHYADTLIRADVGVSGFGLEINMGYWPEGTLPRDILEISRLVDRWSTLGLPLVLILTLPSAPAVANDTEPAVLPMGATVLDVTQQAKNAGDIIETCLAKPAVQGIIWNQLFDGDSPSYPHGGLFTEDGRSKPIVEQLRVLKEHYLS